LFSNAIKFTERGSVTIEASNDENYLIIAVKDTGSGISKQNQKKLFKVFEFIEET
jgi:signal transduction histidine kinase